MNGSGSSSGHPGAYETRWQRIIDCVHLKQPDRMPVPLWAFFWFAKYDGSVTFRDLMYAPQRCLEIVERATLELDPDMVVPIVTQIGWGATADVAGLRTFQWPGHGVGENRPFQYLDKSYMSVEEYDTFLSDPTAFFLKTYMPRVCGAFEGIENMPTFTGMSGLRILGALSGFARPEVKTSLLKLIEAGEEANRLVTEAKRFAERMKTLGYPVAYGSIVLNPYDTVADYWRGATNMMKDMFRHKEKVLEVLERATIYIEEAAVAGGKAAGNPLVFMPTHWAADAFMSQKQFETFWWPPFRRLLMRLVENDLIPMVLWEHDCDKRLEAIADVPAGKCIYYFERTENLLKAHEIMGGHVALRGGVSAPTLAKGTPEDVDAEVRTVVEKVWNKGGKLILDCGIGIPDDAPVENVRAMFAAARNYAS